MKTPIAFATKFNVGDVVRSRHSRTFIGRFKRMTVEKVDFDHSHATGSKGGDGHTSHCQFEECVEYSVVVGAGPVGSADFRARCHASELILVERSR